MLFFKADSMCGANNMSKALALVLLLITSIQILSWDGCRSLVQLPCPLNLTNVRSSKMTDSEPPFPQPTEQPMQQPSQLAEQPTQQTRQTVAPNSYFPEADADVWHCKGQHVDDDLSYTDWVTGNFTDEQALCAAHRQSKRHIPATSTPPRIAFLFISRGSIPLEPVWRKFFAGHEEKFSIYVHVHDPDFHFPVDSLFYNRTVPSKPIQKFEISLPEAMRRLLAYALLDGAVPNAWFHLACDASVPIRGFEYVYEYITKSRQSFVEAFYPTSSWWRANWRVNSTLTIPDKDMRKGEFWITLHRRHAGLVVGDHSVFPIFKHHWYRWGLTTEIYVPTLMTIVDPEGISNRSLMHVNWMNQTRGLSSPVTLDHTMVTERSIQAMQNLTVNKFGFYNIDKRWNDETEKSCVYNGVPNSPCFLFARKFQRTELVAESLLRLSPVLGYL